MKKTLAAVLAAAMALSTATVAFAVDHPDLSAGLEGAGGSDSEIDILYGIDVKRNINSLGEFDGYFLADLYDKGTINVTPIATVGNTKYDSKPSVSLKSFVVDSDTTQTTVETDAYIWKCTLKSADGKVTYFKPGDVIKRFPVVDDGTQWSGLWNDPTKVEQKADGTWQLKAGAKVEWAVDGKDKTYGGLNFDDFTAWAEGQGLAEEVENTLSVPVTTYKRDKLLQLKFKVRDTYKTGNDTVGLKLRVTFKKDYKDADGNVLYKKGDTYTSEEYKWKAGYNEITNYSEDMQVTTQEVDDRFVVMKGGKVYDEVGNGKFTLTFGDDVAMFVGKGSSSQKDQNLFYNLNEDEELTAMYPDIDFEFIEFKGTPSFVNSGSLVFKAENKNYTVYEWDGEGWTPLDGRSTFDPTYKTVTVKNVKKLTKYAVASDVLPVEDEEPEEPAEPVDSTPVAEPDDDEGENPNTGAC